MAQPNETLEQLLTERDVARILRISIASCRRWRVSNHGPKFLKLSTSVRYRPDDLVAWIATCPSGGAERKVIKTAIAEKESRNA